MKFTLDMMVYGIVHYETAEDFFQYVKIELEKKRESQPYRVITMDNIVKKTSMAIDFFSMDSIIDKATNETAKSRSEIHGFLEKIKCYPLSE